MPIWSSDGNVYENEALAILGLPNKSSLPSNQDGPIMNVADTPVQRPRWWEGWRKSENVEDRRNHPFDSTLTSLDKLIKDYDSIKEIDEKSRKEMRKKIDDSLKELKKYSPKNDPWEGLRFMQEDGSLLGYKIREELFEGEDKYFKDNPNVTGMAAETGDIILNPYAPSHINKDSVARNEAFRLYLRDKNLIPSFDLTDEQRDSFKGTPYEGKDEDLKASIAARIYSRDPSAKATSEQEDWVSGNLPE